MALDGNFTFEAAISQFLYRCPKLRSNPKFTSLLHKELHVSIEDVIAAVADPFLHPSYTVPVVGCFRPICRQILQRVVAKLRSVHSFELGQVDDCEEVGEEDIHVIDFYVLKQRTLKLHELACLAFCKALDMSPLLLQFLLPYFEFAPPPFRCLYLVGTKMSFKEKIYFSILNSVRVSYRLLFLEPKVFSGLWDWSIFLDLVQHFCSWRIKASHSLYSYILDIKWCVVQILSVVMQTSDRVISTFGIKEDEALTCLLRWEEFFEDTSLEKVGWYLKGTEVTNESCMIEQGNLFQYIESLGNGLNTLDRVSQRICKHKASCGQKSFDTIFFLTSAAKRSSELVLMAISHKLPVLLYGPAGSGKTAFINYLANKCGSRVLFLHMNAQTDSKSLIGGLMSSEQGGSVKWHPGSLILALLGGFWVVFEDIDKASNEIQSILLPLLGGSSSFVTGHGKVIAVSERFCLFGTITTSRREFHSTTEGRYSVSVLWRKVMFRAPSRDDMIGIINTRYQSLDFFSLKLVDTFEHVNSFVARRFSLRDLLKWCKRIAGLPLNLSGSGLSLFDLENIFKEAVDVFAAFLPMSERRSLLVNEIANLWAISSQGETLNSLNRPTLQMQQSGLQIGRIRLNCIKRTAIQAKHPFVNIRNALHSLERIACSIKYNEPVLLVGETGTGKTTLVQNLAMRLGASLVVMNLSQQTDVEDLLGGYKPVDVHSICMPLYYEFKELLGISFSKLANETLFHEIDLFAIRKKWKKLLYSCKRLVGCVLERKSGFGSKRKRPLSEETVQMWESYSLRLDCALKQISHSSAMPFKFVEGAFVTALKTGQWLLLDEINLAPLETLQRIIGVLEGDEGTLCLTERGDVNSVERHPDFRLFACMNPATEAAKKDLPVSIKNRFTEYFIDEVWDDDDLILFVSKYMGDGNITTELPNKIVQFYKAARKESEKLKDNANQKPPFSLRSLVRALEYTKAARNEFGLTKALYDGFCMFFASLLEASSAIIMQKMILSYLVVDGRMPRDIPFLNYLPRNLTPLDSQITFLKNYVLTDSVKLQLKNLSRAVYIKRYPILLQGPTSSGKTSLVRYLASLTGHEFVRINNHEHTHLQDYFGLYITDSQGRLQFQEGILVKAVQKGFWIVLDELNLAPSEVLEALNRLLDDNRELFVPELQKTISAHPNFMLFATQNPPISYSGRKVLSRAFRNRFLEINVDAIPDTELTTILEKRCCIPASYALKMVAVKNDPEFTRKNFGIFSKKLGSLTPRDLFRWANRFRIFGKSYDDLAKDGYFLLAERLREEKYKIVVKEVLERHLKVKLVINELYNAGRRDVDAAFKSAKQRRDIGDLANVTWTQSMWRLYFLVERCYKMREPVLLVGDTGGGKTTVCQMLSIILGSRLHIINCHRHTEASDFVGGFHPVRERPKLALKFREYIGKLKESQFFVHFSEDHELSADISEAPSTLRYLDKIQATYKLDLTLNPSVTENEFVYFETIKSELLKLSQKWQTAFIWQDGPLVQAMRAGDIFLVDEISLADCSVLERLNSVLEPERTMLLAEKGGSAPEEVIAHPDFFILATMNPGCDHGKKELSPALKNRFTEIWVPSVCDINELKCIALERLYNPDLTCLVDCMLNFWKLFNGWRTGRMLTPRDLLSWVLFINTTEKSIGSELAFLHGAFLALLDGLDLGTCMPNCESLMLQKSPLDILIQELKASGLCSSVSCFDLQNDGLDDFVKLTNISLPNCDPSESQFGIYPFFINKGHNECKTEGFEFQSPTTRKNVLRILRAMQLSKPVLLEGSPGIGKTSLIVALAQHSGHTVVRINLSEQTSMMDLLGSDMPVEDEEGMKFSWVDGILLQALKNGYWILLDELNLAPQSVLEGLNAMLDHRAEVFIPQLGLSFKCPASFRVFACQNPSSQGGGRNVLPKSFLNRFIKVQMDDLTSDDYLFICKSRFPSIPSADLLKLITFNCRISADMKSRMYGQIGSPWVFNLRDVMRSCEIIEAVSRNSIDETFLNIIYLQRLRSETDRSEVMKLYEDVFGTKPSTALLPNVYISPQNLIVGSACLERNYFQPTKCSKSELNLLPGFFRSLEAVAHCVQRGWLCILVGPSCSGKTSLLRLLAQLTGNVLNELNLSSESEVSDFIGSFQHYDSFQNYKALTCQIKLYVDEYFSLGIEKDWKSFLFDRKCMFSKWFSFFASHTTSKVLNSFSSSLVDESSSFLDPFVEIISQLKHDLTKFSLPLSYSCTDLDKCLKIIGVLKKNWAMHSSTKFEWAFGNLVNAIEHGEWVVLDNANLCNPAVLDRVNSLVEPNGSITINECGLVDGKPLLLNAHSKFRLFITVNPKYGEISRAMRNRGVEIFMLQPAAISSNVISRALNVDEFPAEVTFSCKDIDSFPFELSSTTEEIELSIAKRFLVLSGIPVDKMILAMSKAHYSARESGLCLGIQITLLELARWVQLFQQLIMNGNDPLWSLQLSWEHTYLAALGELEGMEVVLQGKLLYLSDTALCKLNPHLGYSLSLPGGWPLPLTLQNFVYYSRESCVKQNCLYLQFLCYQCAYYNLGRNVSLSLQIKSKIPLPAILPVEMEYQVLLPNAQSVDEQTALDFEQANQMLFFAANWTIEQATENDFDVYIAWFKWHHMKLQESCYFLESFYKILEQEKAHPIWKCIQDCRKELLDHRGLNIDMQPIPLFSPKFQTADSSVFNRKCYINAIHSASILRRTFQQWNTETMLLSNEDIFWPVLYCLRQLENELLKLIVNCEELLYGYSDVLELHILFWENIKSFNVEYLSVIWGWLKKKLIKFQPRFPEAVNLLLVEGFNLKFVPGWLFSSEEPTLWKHRGRPFAPCSADMFYKFKQLTKFCETNLQTSSLTKGIHIDEKAQLDVIVSMNADLKRLAMEGLCNAKYEETNHEQCLKGLDETYQRLLSRFEVEKKYLELTSRSTQNLKLQAKCSRSLCCDFSSEMLCKRSCFDSWLAILPLYNRRSLSLDINLISYLSNNTIVDVAKDSEVTSLLQQTIDYSLNNSSRSPVDFSPHQAFFSVFDALTSIDSVHHKKISLIFDMWFGWHFSLWNCFSDGVKSYPGINWSSVYELFPTRMQILGFILQDGFSIKDYDANCLKLRVTSRALWQDSPLQCNLMEVLLSSAGCLFKQIIFTLMKYFKEGIFASLKSILTELTLRNARLEDLQALTLLIFSSNHGVFSSLKESVIQPLLEELYARHSSNDSIRLGLAWAHIGILRLHLLNLAGSDPVMKSILKNSWIVRRKTCLELEIEVRRECELRAGKSTVSVDERIRKSIDVLEMEEKRVQKKIIFRPRPSKYTRLKLACSEFLELVLSWTLLLNNVRCNTQIGIMIETMKNYQVTCGSFITKLSDDYAEYMDLVQPIQAAVYEIKLGISLAISGIVEKEYINKIGIDKLENLLDRVCLIMQFPKVLPTKKDACENGGCEGVPVFDINLLNYLVTISSKICTIRDISHRQQQSIICHIFLLQVAHTIRSSLVMDKDSFILLNAIFQHFLDFWMDMKSKAKSSEEEVALCYKFRPRSVILKNFVIGGVSSFGIVESGDIPSSESPELLMEQEFFGVKEHSEEVDDFEDEWNLIPESILSSLVKVHNQLFGCDNCVHHFEENYDHERLLSFMNSYRLGMTMTEGLQGLSLFMDENLIPEHLLRVCLEYESFSGRKTSAYVHQESNAKAMFSMVEPLMIIQNKAKLFLEQWPEHPGIMKVIEIIQILLKIPPCSPLSKALLGLQLLISKIEFLQENDSKFSLKDEIQMLYPIVSSWQKLEEDSWPALLDGVSEKHELNAAMLWFPLYGIFQRSFSSDKEADIMLIIQSVEDFVCTSSIGQFKKRLELLLAFHGQFKNGVHLKVYDSHSEELLKSLYNFYGYYVQFLPRVWEHIEAGKKNIEKELKECVKLLSWNNIYARSSLENYRRAREKVWKLVDKFNDVLQQPVMLLISSDSKLLSEDSDYLMKNMSDKEDLSELPFSIYIEKLANAERFLWLDDWKCKTKATFQTFSDGSNRVSIDCEYLDKNLKMAWDDGWIALKRIFRNAASFSYIWKHETRNLMKRRALSELLKVLEKCGLSRHKLVEFQELKSGHPSNSFLQPSFDVLHLLLQDSSLSVVDASKDLSGKFEEHADARCSQILPFANKFYFKNLNMIHQLHESRTCFSKDITLDLANQVVSYIEHLIVVQRDQRSVAYCFFGQVKNLQQLCHSLEKGTHCSWSKHQLLIKKHMWKQKDLFERFLAMLKDIHIFLVKVKDSHMDACNLVRDEADHLSIIVDKFIPLFGQSKGKLDGHLMGRKGVISTTIQMPSIVTTQIEELVRNNFDIIKDLEEDIKALNTTQGHYVSVKGSLLLRLGKLISEGKEEFTSFNSEVETRKETACDDYSVDKQKAVFIEVFELTHKAVVEMFKKLDSRHIDHCSTGVLSAGDITSWSTKFQSYMEILQLDQLCDSLCETISKAIYLVDCAGIQKPELCSQVGVQLNCLHRLVELILQFSEAILFEFLEAHRTITEMTNVLAQIFTLLLFKGFGSTKDQAEKTSQGMQDASGTGMGQGEGVNDVSDQIEDEAQLTGAEKGIEDVPDSFDKVASDKDKGIEMDEDFDAESFSISEDSENGIDGESEEDVNLESKMGETGEKSQIVDEKLWDRENDSEPDNCFEKYEPGPSVEEMDTGDRELDGNEGDMHTSDEADQLNKNQSDKQTEEQKDVSDDENTIDEMMMDKDTEVDYPSGIQPTKEETNQEEGGMDESQRSDMTEEGDSTPAENDMEMQDDDFFDPATAGIDENASLTEKEHDTSTDNKNVDLEPNKDVTGLDKSNSVEESQNNVEISNLPQTPFNVSLDAQICWSHNVNMNNNVAPSSLSMDENLSLQFSMTDSSDMSKLAPYHRQPQSSQGKTQPRHLQASIPCQIVEQGTGDLKENVSILDNLQEEQSSIPDFMNEDGSVAAEYQTASESEKNVSQALGPAAPDQIKDIVEVNRDREVKERDSMEHVTGIREIQQHLETEFVQTVNSSVFSDKRVEELVEPIIRDDSSFEALPLSFSDAISGSIVSFSSSYTNVEIDLHDTEVIDMDISTAVDNEQTYGDTNHQAYADWKRYEQSTAMLSQELSEQLGIILEPTIANRYKGNYKTGRRLNLRQVMQYIATDGRINDIWLRRIRPGKCDYQVMIAIDDSRSMSERNCGTVAIEALTTVCRAMTLAGVGQFAVSSFGTKGNCKLLHDFDEPFTEDAGVKIISNLTFKQDNIITDNPVVNLLIYLKAILDARANSARMSSGLNPSHQLTFIISDGRFHEKETLRHYIRNFLNERRLIVLIVLDDPRDSILDLQEVCFESESQKPILKKYLDSFPFPDYIILSNLVELPEALASILTQWFELVRNSTE